MTSDDQGRKVRVALFFAITVTVLLVVVFLLGSAESLWSRRAVLHASFANASGLIAGASVRLAGVEIGTVKSIHFDADLAVKRIDVDLSVGVPFLERVRKDSVAQIASKGLLGDTIIDVTIGSPDLPALKDGDHIESAEVAGLNEVVASVQQAISKVNVLATDVDSRLKIVLTPELAADVGRVAHSAADVIEDVEHGKGLAHELVYDPSLARDASRVLGKVEDIANRASASIAEIEKVLGEVQRGGGLLHSLVYDKGGAQAVKDLEETAHDLESVVTEVRSGHGTAHSLIYEQDKSNLIQNLSEAARIIRHLAEDAEAGKGTVGGLLVDPTVYEDLTTVLGNLKRNELLKALIRYTIVNDNLARTPSSAAPAKPE